VVEWERGGRWEVEWEAKAQERKSEFVLSAVGGSGSEGDGLLEQSEVICVGKS